MSRDRLPPECGTDVVVAGRPRPLPDREVIDAVRAVLDGERRSALVSVTFVGRDAMRRLNRRHKTHDWPTDVLTFSLDDPHGGVAGDVYICPWMAEREAHLRGIPLREELLRLVVHGTLHALGYDHPEDERRTRSEMWRRQERYLEAIA